MVAKVKWVNSWRDIPKDVRERNYVDYQLHGLYDKPTNTIYGIRGKTSKADIEHELYHSKKKHPETPRVPSVFVINELQANMYAYNTTGQPKHILGKLRAIYNDLVKYKYKLTHKEALNLISQSLNKIQAPNSWHDDFKEASKQASRINK